MDFDDLEVELRQEGRTTVEEVGVPVGLLAAAQRRARRRSLRHGAAGALGAFVLVGGAITLVGLGNAPAIDVAAGSCATAVGMNKQASEPPNTDFTESVTLTMLGVRPNAPSFVVMDLAVGTVNEYSPEQHHLPQDAVSGAAITARGDAVVWIGERVYVIPDADFSRPPIEIVPDAVRLSPAIAPELYVVPSPDGNRIWIVQPTRSRDGRAEQTSISLVELVTGTMLVDAQLELNLNPVGANNDSLILNAEQLIETESGWVTQSGSERIVSLGIDGIVEEVAVGTGVAVHHDIVATVDPDRTRLTLVNPKDDSSTTVTMPVPGTWRTTGDPSIPGTAQPLPRVSATGELLMVIGNNADVNNQPEASELYAVSMNDGTTCSLARFDGAAPPATWSRDGRHVVLLVPSPLSNQGAIAVLNPGSPNLDTVTVATVPDEHFILGAG